MSAITEISRSVQESMAFPDPLEDDHRGFDSFFFFLIFFPQLVYCEFKKKQPKSHKKRMMVHHYLTDIEKVALKVKLRK